ncbi:DUF2894 domain-containing protein [Oceanicoccus sp. KOV_DT_Chl]|uniref:DUF2894 domain-containing protein n=1 Tax=Oceanicoccus sp. KOV_DT_Chl TaxID=1904639 RepID=UPI000C7DCA0D|nr:DUF2894 domain-containing protein [Oceanicoccus sp. KOV_DT_Chl]
MNTLAQLIDEVEANDGQHYDPVRFRFIEAMARKAARQPDAVAKLIVDKTMPALQQYQQDFTQAAATAAKSVSLIAEQFPAASDQAQQLLAQQNFKAVAQLIAQLQLSPAASIEQQSLSLSALTQQLLQGVDTSAEVPDSVSLDDYLRQQEGDLLQSWTASDSGETGVVRATPAMQSFGELKSIRLFRESWSKIHSEQRVMHSINDGPEAPGPLNEQKLMIRSLETMRELSPQYLSRFVAYIDTLLWLEQTGKKVAAAKPKAKKKPRAKKTV